MCLKAKKNQKTWISLVLLNNLACSARSAYAGQCLREGMLEHSCTRLMGNLCANLLIKKWFCRCSGDSCMYRNKKVWMAVLVLFEDPSLTDPSRMGACCEFCTRWNYFFLFSLNSKSANMVSEQVKLLLRASPLHIQQSGGGVLSSTLPLSYPSYIRSPFWHSHSPYWPLCGCWAPDRQELTGACLHLCCCLLLRSEAQCREEQLLMGGCFLYCFRF